MLSLNIESIKINVGILSINSVDINLNCLSYNSFSIGIYECHM